MEDCIPIVDVIKTNEVINVTKCFKGKFNADPEFYVRVPGRVNLIGEHIDYCGYPVLPMALEQGVLLAVKPLDKPQIRLTNLNPRYPDWSGDIDTILKLRDGGSPQWYEYVLCGVKGAAESVRRLKKASSNGIESDANCQLELKNISGFMAVVSGTVPPAAGLSSSSALVCAAALALIKSNQLTMGKMEIAKLCATSERLIGTEGGGMDQAIAFLAELGSAQHISWNPLRAQAVSLPDDAVFVVAHSLVEANKAATDHYNMRVRECKLAAKLIAEEAGLEIGEASLGEVHKLLGDDLEGMLARASRLPAIRHQHKPRDRALHVFQEALRVQKFSQLCTAWDGNDRLSTLGGLMRQSHESLRYLYECSHPALDRLVELSDEFGVYARLTGAGWGGCIVALCPQSRAEAYVEMLMKNYYLNHPSAEKHNLKNLVFITKPHQGAQVLLNTEE